MPELLVVENDPDTSEMLTKYFEASGYHVRSATNGREALVAIISRPPQVVILDLLMPDMDGAGVVEVIRSYLRLQSLPVVVVTGVPDSPLADRARELGVQRILVKGVAKPQDILRAVEKEIASSSA